MDLSGMIGMFGDWDGGTRLAFRREHADNILDDIYVIHRMREDVVDLFSNQHPDLQLDIIHRAFYRALGFPVRHVMLGIESRNDEAALVYYEENRQSIATLHATAELHRKADWKIPTRVKIDIANFIAKFLRNEKQ